MQFDELDEGPYRVYVGALETPGGYVAAMVINRRASSHNEAREAYREMSIAGSHRCRTATDAVHCAIARAKEVIHSEPFRLAC